MIVKEIQGDITTATHGIIAHGVNCQGVMGSGVALAIRNRWPKVFEEYKAVCDENRLNRRDLLGHTQLVQVGPSLYVANMFTQYDYGREGKQYASLQAVADAFINLEAQRHELVLDDESVQKQVRAVFEAIRTVFKDVPDNENAMRQGEYLLTAKIAALTAYDAHTAVDDYFLYPVHTPLIGCGLGGLDWNDVRPLIDTKSAGMPVIINHFVK